MNRILFGALCVLLLFAGALQATSLTQEKEKLRENAFQSMAAELGLRQSDTASRDLPGWSKPEIVVVWAIPGWDVEALRATVPGVDVVSISSREEAKEAARGAQAIIGVCNRDVLEAGDGIHWVQVYSSGVERCIAVPEVTAESTLLTNGQKLASPALAEHAIALMMSLVRGVDLYHGNQLNGQWKPDVGMGRGDFMELDGRTVLVVGLGGIGTQVARKAHGLGMRVIATRGSRREGPEYVEYVGLADEVNALASQADVVINTVPLTDRTRGMFDAAFFKAMKPTAYFISVGRGRSTVTEDLVEALNTGELRGAGLDVTDPEPLPEGHVLWSTPRVIITPHTGGRSDRSRDRLFLLVQENLRRYAAGEPLYSVVDIERGY